jgi:hypothetical protein
LKSKARIRNVNTRNVRKRIEPVEPNVLPKKIPIKSPILPDNDEVNSDNPNNLLTTPNNEDNKKEMNKVRFEYKRSFFLSSLLKKLIAKSRNMMGTEMEKYPIEYLTKNLAVCAPADPIQLSI